MLGMCEKKCGECSQCIGQWAQEVIDEKNAEIKDLNLQLGRLRDMLNDVRGLVYSNISADLAAKILRRIEDGPEKYRTNDQRSQCACDDKGMCQVHAAFQFTVDGPCTTDKRPASVQAGPICPKCGQYGGQKCAECF